MVSCCLLPAVCCLLPAACCLLPAACCLLPAACCLLPAACCLPPCCLPHLLHSPLAGLLWYSTLKASRRAATRWRRPASEPNCRATLTRASSWNLQAGRRAGRRVRGAVCEVVSKQAGRQRSAASCLCPEACAHCCAFQLACQGAAVSAMPAVCQPRAQFSSTMHTSTQPRRMPASGSTTACTTMPPPAPHLGAGPT